MRVQSIYIVISLTLISCRSEKTKEIPNLDSEKSEQTVDQIDPLKSQFAELVAEYEAAEPDSKERFKIRTKIVKNEDFPVYETLKFVVAQNLSSGSKVGSYVQLMKRIEESDAIEATRCYELIKDDPKGVSMLHSLGTELGKQEPKYGLEWFETLTYNRAVYFGSVNLGKGFALYASSHSEEEFMPVFQKYLKSSVFDGKSYDQRAGVGSWMRERMALEVLKQLGKKGKLTPELSKRLAPFLSERCRLALGSYPVYSWSHEKILKDFDLTQFPESSRSSAKSIALEKLNEKLDLEECLAWIDQVSDRRSSDAQIQNLYARVIRKSNDDRIIQILSDTEDPKYYKWALRWAKNKAQSAGGKNLGKRIKDFEKERRESKRK